MDMNDTRLREMAQHCMQPMHAGKMTGGGRLCAQGPSPQGGGNVQGDGGHGLHHPADQSRTLAGN